jgi:hypothetical protein
MDLASLASLGKIAGLGGIAIGVVVLLVRPIIQRVSGLPMAERAPTLRLIAMGAFGIGALGIVAWLVSGLSIGNVNVTAGPGGQAAGHDMSNNRITTVTPLGAQSPPTSATPADNASGLSADNANATAGAAGQAAGHDMTGNTITTAAPQGATAPPAVTPATKQP